MFDVKTRFRFSSEGGVGEKTRFGGGRFVIGTPSLPLHKPFSSLTPHMPFSIISIPHTNIISPTSSSSTQKNRIDGNQSYLKHYLIDLFN